MLNKIKTFIAAAVLSGTVSANVQAATITVQDGDTLWDLSRVRNTSVANIQKLNDLHTNLIHPGDVLKMAPEKHYTVKQGDTLWDIAKENHVNVSLIKERNKLISDRIHPGLNLVLLEGLNTTNDAITEKTIKSAAPTASIPKAEKAKSASKPKKMAQKESRPKVTTNKSSTKEITVKATAYTASCKGCSGTTATGINIKANPNAKVIAVDPSVIPLGSKVYVEGFGEAIAADTGGAIKGNRIDVFIPSEQKAINFGVKQLEVKILN